MSRETETLWFQKSNIMNYFFTAHKQNNSENRFYRQPYLFM
ncbi:protein of unknown function [Xenorhabdus doucetiae]|uniref:Uncharacterized protein n=1 Tax=Xenorhabdus doucetiae TaxID=351671 RepID=A0A068QQQ3_9GAMM|nr:protein of unknown function [Xenorhabdus doucetiae]